MMDRMRVVASSRELARVGVVPDDSLVSRARTHSRFFFSFTFSSYSSAG